MSSVGVTYLSSGKGKGRGKGKQVKEIGKVDEDTWMKHLKPGEDPQDTKSRNRAMTAYRKIAAKDVQKSKKGTQYPKLIVM